MKRYYGLMAIAFLAFLGISFFLYNPMALYFLNDDMVHLPLSSKGQLFQHNSFRPIHDILLSVEYKLWGTNAQGYHLVEWAIHVACSVLMFPFSYLFLKGYGNPVEKNLVVTALLSSILFSIYAFHSESVLWLLGSGASLATFFFLLSAITYLKRREGLVYFICSLACFQLGLFTYEAIWAAPIFICLLSWGSIKNKAVEWKQEWVYPTIYCFSFLVNMIIRKMILGELGGSYGDEKLFGLDIKRLVYNFICLFARSFVPPSLSTPVFVGSMVLLSVALFMVIRKIMVLKAYDTVIVITAISFLGALLPVISLGISTHSRESERFLYLPSVFVCILIVYSIGRLSMSKKWNIVLLGTTIIYNSFYTYVNARDYAVAGAISKTIYSHFATEKNNKDTIIMNNFPRQFKGLPLFRSGFKEGLAWLYTIDTSKILIPNEEEMLVKPSYNKAFGKRCFDFYLNEKKRNNQKELTLSFDSSYFMMAVFKD